MLRRQPGPRADGVHNVAPLRRFAMAPGWPAAARLPLSVISLAAESIRSPPAAFSPAPRRGFLFGTGDGEA